MRIIEIPYGSTLYEGAKTLRNDVLRKPLNMQLSAEDTEGEDAQLHIVALDNDGKVAGTITLKFLSPEVLKLRQVAVSDRHRGKGLGRALVMVAEDVAHLRHFKMIEVHSRVEVQKFYEKLGYLAVGAIFIEATVEHVKMYKQL